MVPLMLGEKLAETNMKFLPVLEPCDTWAVFDTTTDEPAEFAGECLIGLTKAAAIWLAARASDDERRNRCRHASSISVLGSGRFLHQQPREQSWG